jgi:FixJ family two-component response regulator
MTHPPLIFVVDDDAAVARAIQRLLEDHGYAVETFTDPTDFLSRPPRDGVSCLVLDLRMPPLSGLDVQRTLLARGWSIPIVFMTGAGDIQTTVQAMRDGAVDFLVKPIDEPRLLAAVSRALDRDAEERRHREGRALAEAKYARLTSRERQVCARVARGMLNKQIAAELEMSEKTVKIHRGRVMHKLEVDSVAALVRLVDHLHVSAEEPDPKPVAP